MANCCPQKSKIYFNPCNKTGDESQQSSKQNIVFRHSVELESFHEDWIRVYDLADFKNIRFE